MIQMQKRLNKKRAMGDAVATPAQLNAIERAGYGLLRGTTISRFDASEILDKVEANQRSKPRLG